MRILWTVLTHAQAISERSDGAFDVTIKPVVHLWLGAAAGPRKCPLPRRSGRPSNWSGTGIYGWTSSTVQWSCGSGECVSDLGGIAKGYIGDQCLPCSASRASLAR